MKAKLGKKALERIKAEAATAELPEVAIVSVWRELLHIASLNEITGEIDPNSVQIPQEQAAEIIAAVPEAERERFARIWIDKGPRDGTSTETT